MATVKKNIKKKALEPVPVVVHEPRMYVGPTIHRFGVIQNVVYTDIPEEYKTVIRQLPMAGSLFMPINQYPEAERSIREHDGYIWTAFKAVLDFAQKLKGEK